MKDYDKNKESLYLSYWKVNSLSGWPISQNFPAHSFKWVENTSI